MESVVKIVNRLVEGWSVVALVAQAAVKKSKSVPVAKLKSDLKMLIENEPDARLDYVEFFEPETLSPVLKVTHATQMALAVFVGKTRLIDNARL